MVDYIKPWLLFWVAAILAHGYMDYFFIRKWRRWSRGLADAPAPPGASWLRTGRIWFAEVLLQRQLFTLSHARWLVHMLIFYGFAGLLFLSIFTFSLRPMAYLGLDLGMAAFFLKGQGYPLIKVWGDAFGLALLAGLLAALCRRLFLSPAQQDNSQADLVLLVFLLWLTVSGFALEVLRLALVADRLARYSFVAHLFVSPGAFTYEQLRPWLTALWSVHAFSGVGLMLYLPHSKLLHSLLAPIVIAMNAHGEQDREDIYWPDMKKHRAPGSRGA